MRGSIIAFSGAHGTGKTFAMLTMACEMKRKNKGAEVGTISEVARRCPIEGVFTKKNPNITEAAQQWIFARQICEDLEACAANDIVVADRTAVDAIAYTSAGGFSALAEAQIAIVRRHIHIYREVFVLPVAHNDRLVDDGFRNLDLPFRLTVEGHLWEIYRRLGVAVSEWHAPADPEAQCNCGAMSFDGTCSCRPDAGGIPVMKGGDK